jgi:amphi-Trp domain-containing protein
MAASDDEYEATLQTEADDDGDGEPTAPYKRKGKINFESVMQRTEAVAYFGALVDGLRHGRLQFRLGDESLSLEPTDQVQVEVKAQKKGDKERVSFELEWRLSAKKTLEVSS